MFSFLSIELLVALLSGGVVVKVVEHLLSRGAKKRDDWRADFEALTSRYQADIARLEAHIGRQDERIGRLEREADEWQQKYYAEVRQRQMLEVAVAAKDQLIDTLRKELAKWETSARAVVSTAMSLAVAGEISPKTEGD